MRAIKNVKRAYLRDNQVMYSGQQIRGKRRRLEKGTRDRAAPDGEKNKIAQLGANNKFLRQMIHCLRKWI